MSESDQSLATFAAGCFWGVEAAFRQHLGDGVHATRVGYTGGNIDHPTYRLVCKGSTGHAEAVQVTYDPQAISYEQLLDIFWSCHDPTQLNRQGPDVGTQYRSAIFCHDEAQRVAAEKSRKQLEASGRFNRPLVTRIEPATTFWLAEDYHQQYLERRGMAACPTSQASHDG